MKFLCKLLLFCLPVFGSCLCYSQNAKIDSLIAILKTTKEDTAKVNALNYLFLEYEYSDGDKAKEYLNQALDLSQKAGYDKGLAATHTNLGYFAEDKGDFPQAIIHYRISLKLSEKLSNKKEIASSYNNIGNVYFQYGNYREALKNYFSALKTREAINDKPGIGASYGNIGNIYFTQGDYPEALKNYFSSMKIRESISDEKGIGATYNNIGNVYYKQGNYPEALKNYTASLKIREAMGDKKGEAVPYNNIGLIYSNQGNYSEALKNHFASLKIREAVGDKAGTAASYGNIGDTYTKQKKYKEAEEFLIKAKRISTEIGYSEYLMNVYNSLAQLDSAKGNFKGAFENQKLHILYRDSLGNEETRTKTIQSQMTFDFEKKEAVANAEHKKELESQQLIAGEKSRKQAIIILFVSGSLLLVLVFAGFVFRSLRLTRKQKDIIELQKNMVEEQKREVEEQKIIVEEHQKSIIDSITYARRIQRSLLPTEKYIEKNLNRLIKR